MQSGVRGVKLHPTFQGFSLADRALLELLEALAGEFPVIAHVGAGAGGDGSNATPGMVRDIVRAVPDLTLIACHFGGYQMFDVADQTLTGVPVCFDTSWPPSLDTLPPTQVRDFIRRHGVARVVFASDWPTGSPTREVAAIRALGLDDDEVDAVLGGNAVRLLGLDEGA